MISSADAHDLFASISSIDGKLSVSARHVDVIVELTFFEDWSARERQRMDEDGDGRIRRVEMGNYVSNLAASLNTRVGVLMGGRRVALALLYAPEVDLLGRDTVGRGHHQLMLHFFAPTPGGLTVGTEIVVEDRLWPEARAVGAFQAAGVGNCLLEVDRPKGRVLADARTRFEIQRYLEAP